MLTRCPWATGEAMIAYHDAEWGKPVHDDHTHFEFVLLEGAQAGLSWAMVLSRRARYRDAFAGFDAARVARYTPAKVERLLGDPGLIRNRQKLDSAVTNARAFLRVQDEFGTFDAYVWRFVNGAPIARRRRSLRDVPATTPQSDALSADLKQRGFTFVGSTICYAYMQAVGLVNDHLVRCAFR
jgi:DNA-3-methyladenine glycosylase I